MNNNRNYTLPIILVTSLFFLWGLAYGLLDVLNKHFQETLNITKQRSTLLQAAYFGAYFLIALPAGYLCRRRVIEKVSLPDYYYMPQVLFFFILLHKMKVSPFFF